MMFGYPLAALSTSRCLRWYFRELEQRPMRKTLTRRGFEETLLEAEEIVEDITDA